MHVDLTLQLLQGSARSARLPGEARREGSATHQEDHFMTQVTTTAFHAAGLVAESYSLHACNRLLTAHICLTAGLPSVQFGACLNQTATEQKMLLLPSSKMLIYDQEMPEAARDAGLLALPS